MKFNDAFFFTAFWEEVILDHPSGGAAGRSGRPTFYHGEGAVVVGFVETKLPSVENQVAVPTGATPGQQINFTLPNGTGLVKNGKKLQNHL